MNYLISESQLMILIEEEKDSKITNKVESLFKLAADTFEKSETKDLMNWKFWRTWGAGIGGFIGPISEFVNSGEFNIEPYQATLIVVAVLNVLYNQNEKQVKKLLKLIEEEGLNEVFISTLSMGKKLKTSFLNFMQSLGLTIGTTFEMMHYAFLIPIFDDLIKIAQNTTNFYETAAMIAKRIVLAKGVSLSGTILTEIISKILKRFAKRD
jgi:hypothetical protein